MVTWLLQRFIRKEQRSHHNGFWEQLPEDVLEQIIRKLNLRIRVGMSMVCRSWRSAVINFKSHNRVTVPWMMLPYERKHNSIRFFDLFDAILYDIKLPKTLQGAWCCGSSKGWLVMLKGSTELFLFNPISGVQLRLPPLKTIPCFQTFLPKLKHPYDIDEFIFRVELSSVDAANGIVAVVCSDNHHILLCRPEDKRWIIWTSEIEYVNGFVEIIFFNGILNAFTFIDELDSFATQTLRIGGGEGDDPAVLLRVVSLHLPDDIEGNIPPDPQEGETETEFGWLVRRRAYVPYFVESKGELLLACKILDDIDTEIVIPAANNQNQNQNHPDDVSLFIHHHARGFEAYKIEIGHPTITSITITKLNSLDDRVLFVNAHCSSSVTGEDLQGLEDNCIFFLAEKIDLTDRNDMIDSRESGIFFFKDRKIYRSFPNIKLSVHNQIMWFIPNI